MMVTTTTLTAVATPHALVVLSVSHGLLFHQPPSWAALLPPFVSIELRFASNVIPNGCVARTIWSPARFDVVAAMTLGCARRHEPPVDATANLTKPQQLQPSPSVLPRCCSPPYLVMGATVPNKRRAQPMTLLGPEPSRSESGDPVCRMFRLPYVPAFAIPAFAL
jgi:hypothetical protein